VTFDGSDYDNNKYEFTLYNIEKAYPRSGPSDGKGGDITVSGQGFRKEAGKVEPKCRFNGTIYDPVSVTWSAITCPMPAAEAGASYYGNVDLAVTANGADWHEFTGGFQYYQQPIVHDISPKRGPGRGMGIINFYGEGFRADYQLASLSCKVGNSIGYAAFVSTKLVRCVVEDMEAAPEGEFLVASMSLNNASWT
jgi:hypothetical protein